MLKAAVAAIAAVFATTASAQIVIGANFDEPTTRYPHGVLGDTLEYGALVIETNQGETVRLRLPDNRVFEDTAPRIADLDADGAPEVVVVESHAGRGARLAAYNVTGMVAATDWIGQRFRWLAPLGIADLDGDGRVELAYVDRPHLAQVLRIVRMEGETLVEAASMHGITNHRIGEEDIAGGIRDCGNGPEMVATDPSWNRLLAITFRDGGLTSRVIGSHQGRSSFAAALDCAR
ncbi:MAG: VCBS repeat-containing protein [Pseudomonadota bacterium]